LQLEEKTRNFRVKEPRDRKTTGSRIICTSTWGATN